MKLLAGLILGILVLSACKMASAEENVFIYNGFLKGEAYKDLPESSRVVYVMGLLDGFLFAPGFGAPAGRVNWLQACTSGMSNTQITAVIDRYVYANPIEWQQPMHVIANNALRAACPPTSPGA